jgi:hypothetical protein
VLWGWWLGPILLAAETETESRETSKRQK